MVAKVEEYSESHRAHGLPDDLLNILKDDLREAPWTAAAKLPPFGSESTRR